MKCACCNKFIENDEDIRVIKRGTYQNKPLCKICFEIEKVKLYGDKNGDRINKEAESPSE